MASMPSTRMVTAGRLGGALVGRALLEGPAGRAAVGELKGLDGAGPELARRRVDGRAPGDQVEQALHGQAAVIGALAGRDGQLVAAGVGTVEGGSFAEHVQVQLALRSDGLHGEVMLVAVGAGVGGPAGDAGDGA